jgi:aspartyl-tRNA(Asn)/glutamyl-tRNA(Gln) amidotransferase subunit A
MQLSIQELGRLIRQRSISPVELTRECLERIHRLNPALHAFITVTEDSALEEARAAEAEIQAGNWRGPLHGIPIGLKDLIDTAGVSTTAASALFADRVSSEDAEVVRRLKAAGGVIVGKQNLHEFAYGGSSMISHYGEVHNPWNLEHIAGGSSGGSAASVAAGLGFAAIGTDTAGSVRQPAALCGVVGLKPTYGRVSAHGVIPLSTSLDHVGPITRTVADAVLMLQIIAGHDAKDPASENEPVPEYLDALRYDTKSFRVGVPRAFFFEDLDREVEIAMTRAFCVLAELTADVRDVSIAVSTDRTLQSAESYEYHAVHISSHADLYQPETLRRIRTGETVSTSDYIRARRELQAIRRDIRRLFEQVDLLVTPTVPISPPRIADLKRDPDSLRPSELVMLRNTRPVNVWGTPAISVPCGFTNLGLPVGIQIIGPPWRENMVIALAHAYEQATEWHKRLPALR